MKKIVPFRKEIPFQNYLSEITSISLEHTIKVEQECVLGEFTVSGDYKMSDTSTTTESFSFVIPFEITLDNHYILDKISTDVDDFYYEIVNNKTLIINIDILLDHLEEKPLPVLKEEKIVQEIKEEDNVVRTVVDRCVEEEELPIKEVKNPVIIEDVIEPVNTTSLFEQFDMQDENYVTYKICIVREGDSVLTICDKYGISEEDLSKYNDLKDLKIGDKVIIPTNYVRN